MKWSANRAAAAIIAVTTFTWPSAIVQAAPQVVFVDDSAAANGDGSAESPVQTIQQGIALLPSRGGIVAIHPGTYVGPIPIDRNNVVLWGLSQPVYDAEGFLSGFTSDDPEDDQVVIISERKLKEVNPDTGEPEALIELRGSRNEVHNVVADLTAVAKTVNTAAMSATAFNDDFYDDVVFSNVIILGSVDIGGISAKANALFEYITTLDPGFVGIWAGGNGHAELRRAHIANKAANVVFAALDESPKEENGPSFLTGTLRESKLANANAFGGFFTDGTGLLVIGRKNAVNPAEPSTILLEATRNTFQNNRRGVTVWPVHGPNGFSIEPTLIGLDFHDNSYVGNRLLNVDVSFQAPPWAGNYFAANSTVLVSDSDGVFPASVDLGPPESGNNYELIP